MAFDFSSFFNEFFVKPALEQGVQGYNLFNTLVYGAILLGLSFYVLFPLLDKKGIKFNFKFFLALIPFILIGVLLRALNAKGLYPKTLNPLEFSFYTFTPGVWFFVAFLVILAIIVARIFSKKLNKIEFELLLGIIGFVFLFPLLLMSLMLFAFPLHFFASLALVAGISVIAILAIKFLKKDFFADKLNYTALIGQAMDSTFTFYAIEFCNYSEQHPVSEAILNLNPALFIFIKIALVALILHFVDAEVKEKNLNQFIKVFLSILGFATGLASLMKLGIIGC